MSLFSLSRLSHSPAGAAVPHNSRPHLTYTPKHGRELQRGFFFNDGWTRASIAAARHLIKRHPFLNLVILFCFFFHLVDGVPILILSYEKTKNVKATLANVFGWSPGARSRCTVCYYYVYNTVGIARRLKLCGRFSRRISKTVDEL